VNFRALAGFLFLPSNPGTNCTLGIATQMRKKRNRNKGLSKKQRLHDDGPALRIAVWPFRGERRRGPHSKALGYGMANAFAALKSQDFAIVDSEGELKGHLRVKPAHVSWRRAGEAKWRRVKPERVIELAAGEGEEADNQPLPCAWMRLTTRMVAPMVRGPLGSP
jgi:hypothetical protein